MNRWKGMVLGGIGAIAGLWAMDTFGTHVAPKLIARRERIEPPALKDYFSKQDHDISIIGRQYRDNESSTAALGRIIYERVKHEEPQPETEEVLSYLVHYANGIFQGAMYGMCEKSERGIGLCQGLRRGFKLWALNDETIVPLLGLQAGPRGASVTQHLNRLGMHLSYGAATGIVTRLLKAIF